jgi:hypothetical protein
MVNILIYQLIYQVKQIIISIIHGASIVIYQAILRAYENKESFNVAGCYLRLGFDDYEKGDLEFDHWLLGWCSNSDRPHDYWTNCLAPEPVPI